MTHSTPAKPFGNFSDFELVRKIVSGETALYEMIIRRYNHFLYKIGRSYGYNHHDTEDLMQETYISVFNALVTFQNRSSFKTWLTRIMLNHCYHKKQKFSFQKESVSTRLPENSNPMFQQNENADSTLLKKEFGRLLEDALLHIPEDYRMVFTSRELNELNVAETADARGISESNVNVRLNRPKKMLRAELEKMYSPKEIFEFNLTYCGRMVANVMQRIQ